MDFSKILFRASANGLLMTNPTTKAAKEAGELSQTTKTYLRQLYRELKYGRRKEFSNKYIQKGRQCEEDAITLYCRVKKRFFKKNNVRLSNDYVTGEPDLFTGLEITEAETTIDAKASWDLFTFPFPDDDIEKMYYWQGQTYMALTGAKKHSVAYCLVNTPEAMLIEEKRRLFYKMNVPTMENPDYIEACSELDKAMTFDDIPIKERVIEFEVERNDNDIELLYSKIEKSRKYLMNLDYQLSGNTSVLLAEYKSNDLVTLVTD